MTTPSLASNHRGDGGLGSDRDLAGVAGLVGLSAPGMLDVCRVGSVNVGRGDVCWCVRGQR